MVDDNATNRRILEETLIGWQMKPTAVDSGRVALAEMKRAVACEEPYSLVLIDCVMPGMDGFALAQHVRETPELAGAIIIALSSATRRGDAARCRELGIASYLMNPVKGSDLQKATREALGVPPPDEDGSAPAARGLSQESRRPIHILLAEDNPVNQKLAARMLEKRGHTVVLADDGEMALASLESRSFDLVLMDVQMPKMDGFEATAAIRDREKETGSHIPIIAMTASAMKGDRERCLEAGMDGYVPKPVQMNELLGAVEGIAPIPVGNETDPGSHKDEVIDRVSMMARVGGDDELLNEVVALFLDDCPRHLSDIHEAIDSGDGQADGASRPRSQRVGRHLRRRRCPWCGAKTGSYGTRRRPDSRRRCVRSPGNRNRPSQSGALRTWEEGCTMEVLIAEDGPGSRRILEATLSKWGYDVVVCSDGSEAWHALQREGAPGLALIDWMMPGMDGVEICRKVRETPRSQHMYVILLTVRESKRDIAEGLQAGADDYITKPFDEEELRARVQVGERVVALQSALADRVKELEDTLLRVKQLQGLLRICSYCKSIRDHQDQWQQLESYIPQHSEAQLSHSICPDCYKRFVEPELPPL